MSITPVVAHHKSVIAVLITIGFTGARWRLYLSRHKDNHVEMLSGSERLYMVQNRGFAVSITV
jgi:hypothetical protein